jgi:hypothetical protein
VTDSSVARDPGEHVLAARVRRQRLEQVVIAVTVNLIKTDVAVGLAMRTSNVTSRQDAQRSLAIKAGDLLGFDLDLTRQDVVGGNQLLCE